MIVSHAGRQEQRLRRLEENQQTIIRGAYQNVTDTVDSTALSSNELLKVNYVTVNFTLPGATLKVPCCQNKNNIVLLQLSSINNRSVYSTILHDISPNI